LLLSSPPGRGRTTVLRKLHEETEGGFVTGKDFIETSAERHPLSLEETRYSAGDYAALLTILAGAEQGANLDAEKIFRFAPKLNAHQIRAACDWLRVS